MNEKTRKIVGIGLMTAIIVVLQAFALGIKFGMFSITLVLVPIIVGAALYGWQAGAWLGFVFGVMTLFDAAPFLAISVPGTVVTCILKGMAAGIVAGLLYKLLEKVNALFAVVVAGIAAPICNTGVFILGCAVFFMKAFEFPSFGAMVVAFVGVNFFIELAVNLVLAAVIVRLIALGKKMTNK